MRARTLNNLYNSNDYTITTQPFQYFAYMTRRYTANLIHDTRYLACRYCPSLPLPLLRLSKTRN